MPQIEQIKDRAQPAPSWPESWPDTPQFPAWYYLPPWLAPPPLSPEDTPAHRWPTYDTREPPASGAAPVPPDPPAMVSLPAVLNIQQASEYLGVCDETMYTLVHRRDFPAFRIGRVWRIDGQKLGEWVRQQAGG